jgi:hypothetical protein
LRPYNTCAVGRGYRKSRDAPASARKSMASRRSADKLTTP